MRFIKRGGEKMRFREPFGIIFIILFLISCSANKVLIKEVSTPPVTLSPGDSIRIETLNNQHIVGVFMKNKKNGIMVLRIQQEHVDIASDTIKTIEVVNRPHVKKPNIYVTIILTLFVIVGFGVCLLFHTMGQTIS